LIFSLRRSSHTEVKKRQVNPLAGISFVFVISIPIFFSFDITTPSIFLAISIINSIIFFQIEIKKFIKIFLPLISLPLGLFFLNIFFYRDNTSQLLINLAVIKITQAALNRSLTVFFRSLSLIYLSVSYLAAYSPIQLVNSIMQHLHFSPRIGFSIFAAWNTIPYFKEEYIRIKNTQLIRKRGKTKPSLENIVERATTLLVNVIRHAERVSISMFVRGIDNAQRRSFLNQSVWTSIDTLYLTATIILTAVILLLLIKGKIFVFGLT